MTPNAARDRRVRPTSGVQGFKRLAIWVCGARERRRPESGSVLIRVEKRIREYQAERTGTVSG